jgi:hypothetical protein
VEAVLAVEILLLVLRVLIPFLTQLHQQAGVMVVHTMAQLLLMVVVEEAVVVVVG